MSKKNFKSSFDNLLGGGDSKKVASKSKKEKIKETKSTFVVRCDQLDQLRAISYMERKMIKEVLDEALSLYIEKYEKNNGQILLPKNNG
jgi:hypothetical protein